MESGSKRQQSSTDLFWVCLEMIAEHSFMNDVQVHTRLPVSVLVKVRTVCMCGVRVGAHSYVRARIN